MKSLCFIQKTINGIMSWKADSIPKGVTIRYPLDLTSRPTTPSRRSTLVNLISFFEHSFFVSENVCIFVAKLQKI